MRAKGETKRGTDANAGPPVFIRTAYWAPDATIKLASGLDATDRDAQACAAVREFFERYGEGAPTTLINRAERIRDQAECEA